MTGIRQWVRKAKVRLWNCHHPWPVIIPVYALRKPARKTQTCSSWVSSLTWGEGRARCECPCLTRGAVGGLSATSRKPPACPEGWLPWRALRNNALYVQRGDVRHQAPWSQQQQLKLMSPLRGSDLVCCPPAPSMEASVLSPNPQRGRMEEGMKEALGGKGEGSGQGLQLTKHHSSSWKPGANTNRTARELEAGSILPRCAGIYQTSVQLWHFALSYLSMVFNSTTDQPY